MSRVEIDLFVSHRGIDKEWVQYFVDRIEQCTIEDHCGSSHIKAFYAPRDLPVGSVAEDYILKQAHRARFVVLVMTPEFFDSPYTSKEVNVACREDKLIPLLRRDHSLDGKPIVDLPFLVRDWNYIDFRDDTAFEFQLAKVIALVRNRPSNQVRPNAFIEWLQPILEILKGAQIVDSPPSRTEKPRLFKTLERAYDHVVDRLVWVVSGQGTQSTLLGCAWSWRDNRLLCAAGIGKLVDNTLTGGRRVEIERARLGKFSNEVREVREVGLPNLAILRVRADFWLPKHVNIAWGDTDYAPKKNAVLGAVAYEFDPSGLIKHPVLARLEIGAHGEVERMDNYGEIAPGTPLFDCSARLVGFISKAGKSELSLEPFLTQ